MVHETMTKLIWESKQRKLKEKCGSENEEGERDVKGCLGDNWWKRETQKSPLKLRRPLVWYMPPN